MNEKKKELTAEETIDAQLSTVFRSGDTTAAQQQVDAMYENFEQNINVETELLWSEFEKFLPLFNLELRQKAQSGLLPVEEAISLEKLSQSFYTTVNSRKRYHVIDDVTKERIITFPPLYNNIDSLFGHGGEALDILQNIFAQDDGNKSGVSVNRMKNIVEHVGRLIAGAQNAPDVIKSINEFNELAVEFHTNKEGLADNSETNTPSGFNEDDSIEFAPVDE